jgi:hypothetical protein
VPNKGADRQEYLFPVRFNLNISPGRDTSLPIVNIERLVTPPIGGMTHEGDPILAIADTVELPPFMAKAKQIVKRASPVPSPQDLRLKLPKLLDPETIIRSNLNTMIKKP